MSIGAILTRPHPAGNRPRVTNQNVADMMLEADQRRRAAKRRGDHMAAAELQREIDLLASALS